KHGGRNHRSLGADRSSVPRAPRRRARGEAMSAGVYRAVRWRSDGASLALWTQMAARVAVGITLVWGALTFGLVWYWTGYYGGVAAHRHFRLWILTWFFSEIIPL